MISFANPHGSRVATLVVWGGEWEVQEGLGRASKPSPTLLAPAERVLLSCELLLNMLLCFVNNISLLIKKRFTPISSKPRIWMQQVCQTEDSGIEKDREV